MTPAKTLVVVAVAAALSSVLPAAADSFASSASSASITASVGSVSTSFGKSSDSATKTAAAADGDYVIAAIAAAPERPGTLRLTLQAQTDKSADREFYLYLPQTVAERAQLAQGGTVTARARIYGTEFAQRSASHENTAFFLVLADETYRELQARAVQL
jgi:hypothetical protein